MENTEQQKTKLPVEKEAEILFEKIGLATEEQKNRFGKPGPDDDLAAKYEIHFTNNSEVKNG